MSTSIYRVEYECDCGIDYGNCGAKCAIILKSNNSCDIYTLYTTDGHKNKFETTQGGKSCFTDNYLTALHKVIIMIEDNSITLTEEEKKIVFQ